MQNIILREKEPITPFIERARDLYERAGISTIMVAGSSGAYFYIADTILQMDSYIPYDITEKTKSFLKNYKAEPIVSAPDFCLPDAKRILLSAQPETKKSAFRDERPRRNDLKREERIKVKVYGKDSLQVGKEPVDLRFVEQLIDGEQTNALAQMLRYCLEKQLLWRLSVPETVAFLEKEIQKGGLCSISDSSYAAMGLCLPRTQEIFACLNRYRG